MAYATPADFYALGLPLASLDGIDPAPHLTAAQGEIDSYLRGRVVLPIAATPELVRLNVALAADSLMAVRGYDPRNGADANVKAAAAAARVWLGMHAEGKVSLAVSSAGAPIVRSRQTAEEEI
jgi:phage gp36-like protein